MHPPEHLGDLDHLGDLEPLELLHPLEPLERQQHKQTAESSFMVPVQVRAELTA